MPPSKGAVLGTEKIQSCHASNGANMANRDIDPDDKALSI